ncbi:MAG: acyl carrier protein [Candidatus Sericytochromatia bacterium]|nr:acyl carrier protein [Candidatus Sericytochromatia bacterium]
MNTSLDDQLRELLCEALGAVGLELTLSDLHADLSLAADLGCDSFQLMQVSRSLEEAFELKFTLVDWYLEESDREQGPAFTVGSLLTFITSQVGAVPEVFHAGS